jgi:hypothetical protein
MIVWMTAPRDLKATWRGRTLHWKRAAAIPTDGSHGSRWFYESSIKGNRVDGPGIGFFFGLISGGAFLWRDAHPDDF